MFSSEPTGRREEVRTQIREFLTTRRARITPAEAGLPTFGDERRRVPGLRREETALLVGVSPQYYVRLERGDATGVSDSVIDGLTHALRLDDAERAHLVDLLRTAGSPARARRRTAPPVPTRVRSTIQRVLDSMVDVPAAVVSGRLDIVATNVLGRALFMPMYQASTGTPNNARYVFLDASAPTFFREWDVVANDTVALLRAEAGRRPYDRDLSDLVGELSTRSDDFRRRWAAHDVRVHSTGVKRVHHPVVGDLDLPYESLPLEVGSSTHLATYVPEPDSASYASLRLLATWAAGTERPSPLDPRPRRGTLT